MPKNGFASRLFLDNAQDAILVCDLKYQILYWNNGAERIYGWPLEDVLGRNIFEVLAGSDSRKRAATAHRALETAGEWKAEIRQVTKDGQNLFVESRWTLVGNESGQPDYILIINTDVTEQKRTEEHLLPCPADGIDRHARRWDHSRSQQHPFAGADGGRDDAVKRGECGIGPLVIDDP